MGVALDDRHSRGGRDGAHVYLSRPGHAAHAAEKPMVVRTKNLKPEAVVMKAHPGSR